MLDIIGLRKSYGKTVAVDGLDLCVRRGETVVIMGPSGCGKSTVIRCINRLIIPDAGRVLFDGEDLSLLDEAGLRRVRRKIGFVFQHFNLVERLTALENVMLGLVLGGVSPREARRRSLAALERVGLASAAYRHPAELSGGQKQRVGIARGIVGRPELMLWDEPTAALDPIMVHEVLAVMEELVRSAGTTQIIVTHEVFFALRAADRVVLMDRGRIVEEGTPDQVFLHPRSEVGRKYRELIEDQIRGGLVLNSQLQNEKREIHPQGEGIKSVSAR